jgi:hypothetical protein
VRSTDSVLYLANVRISFAYLISSKVVVWAGYRCSCVIKLDSDTNTLANYGLACTLKHYRFIMCRFCRKLMGLYKPVRVQKTLSYTGLCVNSVHFEIVMYRKCMDSVVS